MPPPFMPPLTRGLSNAQHLTGGEIFPFLSLRLLPPAKATSLPEGGTTGRRKRRPLQTGRRVVAPYARMAFLFFNRNGQDRSLHAQNTIYRVGRGDSPVRGNVCEADKRVPEFGEFCSRRYFTSNPAAGASPRPTLILYFVRSKNTPTTPNLSS